MKKTLALALALCLGFTFCTPAYANDDTTDENLHQHVMTDEKIAEDVADISDGHVDIGPRIIDGKLKIYLREDSSGEGVWRDLDKTVLRLGDGAKKRFPEKEGFEFLEKGDDNFIYVAPQIQKAGVVWPGWNTQSPEVVENVKNGATLRLLNVQGPGQMAMFLESGVFAPPQLLWNSQDSQAQEIWMDLNTHTHANWVFNKPGVYLANIEMVAQMLDGSTQSTVATLRFAVGDVPTDEVLAVKAEPNKANLAAQETVVEKRDATDEEKFEAIKPLIYGGVVVLVLGLIVIVFAVLKNRKNKRQAYQSLD